MFLYLSICFHCSVAQSYLTLCSPMDCNTSGFPVLHHLRELAQTHVHWVGDAIQPSCPLLPVPFSSCLQSFPVSRSFPMTQFFTSCGQSIGVSASASVLPMNIQGWFPLELTGLLSLQSKVFSNTTVPKHLFFSTQSSLWLNSYIYTWLLEKPLLWLDRPLLAKWCVCFLIHCLGLS